jgi:hypothetical protein
VNGWSQILGAWSQGWKELRARAAALYASAVQADSSGAAARISGFTQALGEARATLDRIRSRLPGLPDPALVARYQELERRWHDLAAGLFADATPVATPVVGMPPALVVGGLAITAVGLAWAFAAYEYALNLQEQTALAERELDARVAASQQGRVLPPSTLPVAPPVGAASMGLWLLGGLALTAGVLVVPLWLGRR